MGLERVIETMHARETDHDGKSPALSPAHEKLAEVIAYARLSAEACGGFAAHQADPRAREVLQMIRDDAQVIGKKALELAGTFEDRNSILQLSREIQGQSLNSMRRFLGPAPSLIEELDYVAMAQAETIGHWGLLPRLGGSSGEFDDLAEWALPTLRGQLRQVVTVAAALGNSSR